MMWETLDRNVTASGSASWTPSNWEQFWKRLSWQRQRRLHRRAGMALSIRAASGEFRLVPLVEQLGHYDLDQCEWFRSHDRVGAHVEDHLVAGGGEAVYAESGDRGRAPNRGGLPEALAVEAPSQATAGFAVAVPGPPMR